ncbi:MAG TPA: DEAD/DEAH box helicase [Candidatus Dormibacteraeota bacterium]|nr:DEAD/DEAH box helicase [Candidatus Dormibacteraeota bacterium]
MSEKQRQNASRAPSAASRTAGDLSLFHPAAREWFEAVFPGPTKPQRMGWPAIARGDSTLILAPTGTGKTLAAFFWCINRLMFASSPDARERCRVLYISPIKALAVDVERNLRAPLVGIAQAARRLGVEFYQPSIAIRTGDTPPAERARFLRHPSDILITTPESLYLLLTSNAREALRSVETVVVDEIHAIVPTKRGSHLAMSLERLEHLCGRRLQRIGLSATQRPLEEVARYLGGAKDAKPSAAASSADASGDVDAELASESETGAAAIAYRDVTIVDASDPKRLDLRVEIPVEDMTRLDEFETLPSGPASQGPVRGSIWTAIHPKLLEAVRTHRSTLIFVNSRRLAERISGAINDLAGETLVRAHHGSVAVTQRKEIEDRLKLGTLRGLVATSSLELGIDMGSIDLVIQIESPTSVTSGMQRVGRANHQVGAVSKAVIFPKYRADLVACAAITRAMYEGNVESVRYPRNALDVLAQHIVAMVALESWDVTELFRVIRRGAPYAALNRSTFESVLDMLAGRYPSDEFVELRPRLTWDRVAGRLIGRKGAHRVAVINGGTIPDRGLYGVFLEGAAKGARVGELDEEMVFESRAGDTIILGATTWKIQEISHDRVLVSPAPGEPGKMPFWHGDTAGRPAEFGEEIGRMTRELLRLPRPVAITKLVEQHSLDGNAAENLVRYLEEQAAATNKVPSDEDIVIEVCHDELGDRRICVLTPFGSRVHAPWCMAVTAKLRAERGLEVESMWSDDGFVLRFPENDVPLQSHEFLLPPAELKELLMRQVGSTSLFAAKFREAAARALLLPKRRPGMRAPLWQQRKRAADLLAVAARYSSFPIILETYRECLGDVFDLPAAANLLGKIQRGEIRVTWVESNKPSPFAASLLFSYIANYIYEGDAPLAERRAQALSIDQSQLEDLLGDTDLRELLDRAALEEVETKLQVLDPDYQAEHADEIHDLLLRLGDLSDAELLARCTNAETAALISQLIDTRRALRVRIAGEWRYIPVEYAARYRDAFGIPLPPGLPEAFLEQVDEPLVEIGRRYARTHGPFTTQEVAARFQVQGAAIDAHLRQLHHQGKLLQGEFRPSGHHHEWCDPEILQQIRRKSLARLRREVEPVEKRTFARFSTRWQGVAVPRRGLDALLDSIESMQGAAVIASELEREILPARIADYRPSDLDTLMAAGEVVWVGLEPIGDRDGRISLFLTESLPLLLRPGWPLGSAKLSERAENIAEVLEKQGASFYSQIHEACGGGFPGDTVAALWELVWAGRITNDTFDPLRTLVWPDAKKRKREMVGDERPGSPEFLRRLRSRSAASGRAPGRWSLIRTRTGMALTTTQWSVNVAQQLLTRHGIVMRESAMGENIPGGYNTIYPALKTMEDSGWVRRGMFVAGLGAAQFAMPSAVEMLRSLRVNSSISEAVYLAASDPANPYGTLLPWPRDAEESSAATAHHAMARASGAGVILINGELAAFLRRRNPSLRIFLPDNEPERTQMARKLAKKLAEVAICKQSRRQGLLIGTINEEPARDHFLGRFLEDAGFVNTALGFQMRRIVPIMTSQESGREVAEENDQDFQESA